MQTKTLQAIFSRRMIITLFYGFSSGLPLLATGGTLQAWLVSENIDIKTIGFFALTGLPFTLKFLWAPIFDRYIPNEKFGRRRSWILICQILLFLSLLSFSFLKPSIDLFFVATITLITCFFSASQDIVLDAHRRDTLADIEIGFGSSLFVNGYRIGMLVSGALALTLSDIVSWHNVYLIISCFMFVGIIATFFAPEPAKQTPPKSFTAAVIEPLKDFFLTKNFLWILVFILIYKVGDSLASAMTTPYILQMGYSRTDLGTIAKAFGLIATICGGLLGGLLLFKLSINRSLFYFGILQAISTLGFILLNYSLPSFSLLAIVIGFENFSSGLGTTAFVAYMASLTNKKFSATQYALLTSIMGIPRTLLASGTGVMVSIYGWNNFFIICTLMGFAGLVLIFHLDKQRNEK